MKSATYEDVLNAPRNKVAEILDGELFLSPRERVARQPGGAHARGAAPSGRRVAIELGLGRLWADPPRSTCRLRGQRRIGTNAATDLEGHEAGPDLHCPQPAIPSGH
jgi:hypothetical protein